MAIGRRLAALLTGIAAVGILASCAYDDSRPPTGEGRPFGFLLFLVLLVPALLLVAALVWFHLRASPIIGGRPGLVWVAVGW